MNTYSQSTNTRSSLINEFYIQQTHARRDALFAKLLGKNTTLARFPEEAPRKSPNRHFAGTQDIPLEKIAGTLNRQSDFDHKFRPLKSYLRDRWVNVYLTLQKEGWAPVLVHKVDDQYYVEDGHHRVSVARALGLGFLEAKVWEYPTPSVQPVDGKSMHSRERIPAKACAAD
jgi:hypothetical protein